MNRETVKVTIHTYKDPKTGKKHILPSDETIEATYRTAEMREKEASRKKDAAYANREQPEEGFEARALQLEAEARDLFTAAGASRSYADNLKDQRAVLLATEHSQVNTYVVLCPTEEERINAEDKAKKIDTRTQQVLTDTTVMRRELLPISVEGMTPEAVKGLHAPTADVLWKVLLSAAYPSEDEILFLSGSSTSS